MRESLRERAILLLLAPHLLRTLPIYVPRTSAVLRTGLTIYDALAAGVNVARRRRVDADELSTYAAGMEHEGGGLVYYECATDDARLTLEVAQRRCTRTLSRTTRASRRCSAKAASPAPACATRSPARRWMCAPARR